MTILICFGCRKAGSTLAFELTSELLRRAGHPQDRLPGEILDLRHTVNFVSRETGLSMELLKRIEAVTPPNRIIALKTHLAPPSDVLDYVKEGRAFAQAVLRDPRDNVLSLRDAGRKARRRGEQAFSRIRGVLGAITPCEQDLARLEEWTGIPQTLVADYDEVAFSSRHFLARVADQLGLGPVSDEMFLNIEQEVKGQRFTQHNKGIAARHRDELTVRQYEALTRHFAKFLKAHLPHRLDALDLATIAEADGQQRPSALKRDLEVVFPPVSDEADATLRTRVKKTFVVLGCPRGGTSLIAGALYHSGISMGNFRTGQYEDQDFKIDPKRARSAKRLLRPRIRVRNSMHEYWGWKVPNAIYYIDRIRKHLVNPQYIFIYRDPEAVARSSARHDGVDWNTNGERLLRDAMRHTDKLEAFEKVTGNNGNTHVFRHEDIHADPEAFIDRLFEIVAPLKPSREEVRRFINREGGYRTPEALPFVDYTAAIPPSLLGGARGRLRAIRKSR